MPTPVTTANFSLFGWGAGAVINFVSGTGRRWLVNITAGTGAAHAAQVIYTYVDGPFPSAPLCRSQQILASIPGSGELTDQVLVPFNDHMLLVYAGTPLTGKLYVFICDVLGV